MPHEPSEVTRLPTRRSAGGPDAGDGPIAAVHERPRRLAPPTDPLALVGRTVSHFRVVAPIGTGGMGAVYRGEDTRLGRAVALKFLLPAQRLDPASRERFLREARAAAALDHPNLCAVHEVGESEDGWPFLAMPLYAGETLAARIAREAGHALPVAEALDVVRQVARGLRCAHDAGIVHRDLKPGNVMLLPDGGVKILDFGIAKAGGASLTGSGVRLGTVAYMAPEQVFGEPLDARADLWALGVLAYEMLAGRRAFEGEHELHVAYAVAHEEPAWPLGTGVPAAVERVVRKLLEKDPARRYAAAADVLADLERPPPPRRTRPGPTWTRRLGAAGLAAALLAITGDHAATRVRDPPAVRSLAVLPLSGPPGDSADAYLAHGMTEALTAELGRAVGVRVTSGASAARQRETGARAQDVARALRADALVRGTLRRGGGRVRVGLELVDGRDGRRVWAGRFERDARDLLRLQQEAARAIASRVRVAGPVGESARAETDQPRGRRPPDPTAYDLYLKGRYHYARYGQQAFRSAAAHFDSAIARDPAFAEAYAAKAFACAMTLVVERPAPLDACEAAARRALALDGELPEAHAALGHVLMYRWDWGGAEAEFRRALAANPSSVPALQWYAQLLRQTMRADEALAVIRRAESLDPLDLYVRTQVGWVLFNQRRHEEALAQWDEVLALDPDYGLALYNRGLVHVLRGRPREALAAADRAAPRLGERSLPVTLLRALAHAAAGERARALRLASEMEAAGVDRSLLAVVRHRLGDDQAALSLLEESFRRHDPFLPNTTSEPWFDGLRSDPRFRALRASLGLAGR